MTRDLSDINLEDLLLEEDEEEEELDEELELVPRLCNEIQLFDLCERETARCMYRDGKFCTDVDMLRAFEGEPEPDDTPDPAVMGGLELDENVMYDDEEGVEADQEDKPRQPW